MTTILQKDESGSAVLRQTADPVAESEINSDRIQGIIDDMQEALHDTDDGVAIAAPQIGKSVRLFLVRDKVFANRDDADNADKVFINPELINTSQEKVEMQEGCLSVRNVYGNTKRYKQATVRALDQDGNEFEMGASGLLAQIFQHEIEHLDGILFTDKAGDLRKISEEERRKRMQKSKDFENNT